MIESEMIEIFFFEARKASSDGFRIRTMYWKSKSWDLQAVFRTQVAFIVFGGLPAKQTHAYEGVASMSLIGYK